MILFFLVGLGALMILPVAIKLWQMIAYFLVYGVF